jgi:hypothetical protein
MNLEKDILTIENITEYILQLCTFDDIKSICSITFPKNMIELTDNVFKHKIKTISSNIFKNKSINIGILKFLFDYGVTLDLNELCKNELITYEILEFIFDCGLDIYPHLKELYLNTSLTPEILELLVSHDIELIWHLLCKNKSITYDMLKDIAWNEIGTNLNITPLHALCCNDSTNTKMLELAFQQGADPNIQDDNGRNTPIHYYCQNNLLLKTIKILIQYNVNFNICNSNNSSPIHVLTRRTNSMNVNTINVFLQNGFKINIKNFTGHTVKNLLVQGYNRITKKEMLCALYKLEDYDIFINLVEDEERLMHKYIHHLEKIKNLKIYLSLILLRFTICGPIILTDIIENLFFFKFENDLTVISPLPSKKLKTLCVFNFSV